MRQMKTGTLIPILLLSCILNTQADDSLPVPFKAVFDLLNDDVPAGTIHYSFKRLENGEFAYYSYTQTTGLVALFYKLKITEQSRLKIADGYVQPLLYRYHRIKKKKERHIEVQFDWTVKQIKSSVNGQNSAHSLELGILDKLSYQVALMRDLKKGEIPDFYQIFDGQKNKNYYFKFLEEANIETPLGHFETIKLSRYRSQQQEKQEDESLLIWCAKELHYLPIRVDSLEEDGRVVTAIIRQFNLLETVTLVP